MTHRSKGKLIITTIFCVMMFASFSLVAQASTKTQSDAFNWACARGNEHWNVDYDGSYGCQCVDLILAYYDYLEGWHTSGNAIDYTGNALPSGWKRIYSNPQPGDVVVFKKGAQMSSNPNRYANSAFGHIGIIWRVNASGTISTIETNGDCYLSGGEWIPISPANYFERITSGVACYIRPVFANGSGSGPTSPQTQSNWTVGPVNAGETNAVVSVKLTLPSAVQFQWAGCNFFDENGNEVAKAGEYTSIYGSYINISYDINAETHLNYVLTPGTTYKYQFYATYGSVDHFSPMYTFKTKDHSYTVSKKDATCTTNGSKIYACSGCGYSYIESIPATGHNYLLKNTTKATCTANGSETYICGNCGNSYTNPILAVGHRWDDGVVTEAATAAKDGVKTFTCTVCRKTRTEAIPAIRDEGKKGISEETSTAASANLPGSGNSGQSQMHSSSQQVQKQTNQQSLQKSSSAHKYLSVGTSFNCAGKGRFKVTGKGCVEFVRPVGNPKTVDIPDTIVSGGISYKVTSIAAKAFKNNKKLTKVIIGRNIRKIGARAFSGCKKLKTIFITTNQLSKKRIGTKAFSDISRKAVVKISYITKYTLYKKILRTKGLPRTAKFKIVF